MEIKKTVKKHPTTYKAIQKFSGNETFSGDCLLLRDFLIISFIIFVYVPKKFIFYNR